MHMGFNRDIVECKVASLWYMAILWLSFNRDIVECKEASKPPTPDSGRVLIET